MYNAINRNTDIEQCKKDILYLTEPIENWKEKQFLYSALISHLTYSPFWYDRDVAINAYEDLTNTHVKIIEV
jgi:hypothetical protein